MATSGFTVAIGDIIRTFRQEKGVSGNALAKRAGIAQPYLWRIENGEADPPASTIEKIASALGVQPGELLPTTKRRKS